MKNYKLFLVGMLVVVAILGTTMIGDFTQKADAKISVQDAGDICHLVCTDIESGKTDWKMHRRCVNTLLGIT